MPEYVSTSIHQDNVQSVWDEVEQSQVSEIEASSEAVSIAQDEFEGQLQAPEPEPVNTACSGNVNRYESYAREYLDNYYYCINMLMAETNKLQEHITEQANTTEQAGEPHPVNLNAIEPALLWIDLNTLRLDNEVLPVFFPHRYKANEEEDAGGLFSQHFLQEVFRGVILFVKKG